MILYSRLKTKSHTICCLIVQDIPLFEIIVELPTVIAITLYSAHSQPLSPTENDRSAEGDAELMLIAKKIKANNRP